MSGYLQQLEHMEDLRPLQERVIKANQTCPVCKFHLHTRSFRA